MFLNDWKDSGKIGMVTDFEGIYMTKEEYEAETCPHKNVEGWERSKEELTLALAKYETVNVLLASYSYENYSGDAFALFEQGGKLYEVNGGHCSCHGLEGQWIPEETTLEALSHRLEKGTLGTNDWCGNEFASELRDVLNKLKSEVTNQ